MFGFASTRRSSNSPCSSRPLVVSERNSDAVELAQHVEQAGVLKRLAAAERHGLDAVSRRSRGRRPTTSSTLPAGVPSGRLWL